MYTSKNYRRHELIHKILWSALLIITIIVVGCDISLYFQDRAEKKQAATQQTRVVHKKAPSTLKETHRPKSQKWPKAKQSKKTRQNEAQAKQAVNRAGVSGQQKSELLSVFNGMTPSQQQHVLQVVNSGMSNQAKMAALKSYMMSNN